MIVLVIVKTRGDFTLMRASPCGSAFSGAVFSGTRTVRDFDVSKFWELHAAFFRTIGATEAGTVHSSTITALAEEVHARGLRFSALMTFGEVNSNNSAPVRFSFDAQGLDSFACMDDDSFIATFHCDGHGRVQEVGFDVSLCARFMHDPGFSSDLAGLQYMSLPVVDDVIHLQKMCNNLMPLHRATVLVPQAQLALRVLLSPWLTIAIAFLLAMIFGMLFMRWQCVYSVAARVHELPKSSDSPMALLPVSANHDNVNEEARPMVGSLSE